MNKKKVLLILSMVTALLFTGCGAKNATAEDDRNVKNYVKEKYGFEPNIAASQQEFRTTGAGLLSSKEGTGIYDYNLTDPNGKDFHLKYYSSIVSCADDYHEEQFTEEMKTKIADLLHIEIENIYLKYSDHNMFGMEDYDSIDEVIKSKRVNVSVTTFDDFNVADLAGLENDIVYFNICKLNKEYGKDLKISADQTYAPNYGLAVDYCAQKREQNGPILERKYKRIDVDENIVFVYEEITDDNIEVNKITDDSIFAQYKDSYTISSPIYHINTRGNTNGSLYFLGNYYDNYDLHKTVLLEKYNKHGKEGMEIRRYMDNEKNLKTFYYTNADGDITFAVANPK